MQTRSKFSKFMFSLMVVFMGLGFLAFIASIGVWIWCGWSLAWRIGLTGLIVPTLSALGWSLIYSLSVATDKITK